MFKILKVLFKRILWFVIDVIVFWVLVVGAGYIVSTQVKVKDVGLTSDIISEEHLDMSLFETAMKLYGDFKDVNNISVGKVGDTFPIVGNFVSNLFVGEKSPFGNFVKYEDVVDGENTITGLKNMTVSQFMNNKDILKEPCFDISLSSVFATLEGTSGLDLAKFEEISVIKANFKEPLLDCYNDVLNYFKDFNNVKLSDLACVGLDLTTMDLLKDVVSEEDTISSGLEKIKTAEIGVIMNYKKVEVDGVTTWYKVYDEENPSNNEEADEIIKAFCDIKINDLIDGNVDIKETVLDQFENKQIGEIMGYEYDTVDGERVYKDSENNALTGILKIISVKTISEITSDSSIFESIKIGEIMGYTKNGEVWVDSSNVPVSGINKIMADWTIQGLTDGTNDITKLKIGEVIGYSYSGGVWYVDDTLTTQVSGIQKIICDKKVEDLDDASMFDNEKLGTLLGYTLDGEVWYKDSTPVMGIELKFANKTLNEIKDIKSFVNDLTLQDVVSEEDRNSGALSIIPSDTKISELATTLNDTIQNASMDTLISAGVLQIDLTTQAKLDITSPGWRDKNFENFISSIIP